MSVLLSRLVMRLDCGAVCLFFVAGRAFCGPFSCRWGGLVSFEALICVLRAYFCLARHLLRSASQMPVNRLSLAYSGIFDERKRRALPRRLVPVSVLSCHVVFVCSWCGCLFSRP